MNLMSKEIRLPKSMYSMYICTTTEYAKLADGVYGDRSLELFTKSMLIAVICGILWWRNQRSIEGLYKDRANTCVLCTLDD